MDAVRFVRIVPSCYGMLPRIADGTLSPRSWQYSRWIRDGNAAKHVLIVDEDREARAALAAHLERHGFRVTDRRHGLGCTRALERARIDLVVLDVRLSDEDGLRLCRSSARGERRAA